MTKQSENDDLDLVLAFVQHNRPQSFISEDGAGRIWGKNRSRLFKKKQKNASLAWETDGEGEHRVMLLFVIGEPQTSKQEGPRHWW